MKNKQITNQYGREQQYVIKKKETRDHNLVPIIGRLLRCTMIVGAVATLLLFLDGGNRLFNISPAFADDFFYNYNNNGAIQGRRIDQNESLSNLGATITIASVGSFTGNPYTSGLIAVGTYTVSSSQPAGYSVSYSTSPTGGASTYVSGTTATVTVTSGQSINLWWKYSPTAGTSAIQGSKVDQNGTASNFASTITISGIGSFTDNPYASGTIVPGTYTVSSSQPTGFIVSYSTNPAGGPATYIVGSTATVTVLASQTVILWWKYTPITGATGAIRGSRVDQNGAITNLGITITVSGVGPFTTNPYNSGQINPGTYTVSSSQPAGYTVSYSTNPAGGASTYTSGAIATVTVAAGQTIDVWWKYAPVTTSIQGYKVDQNASLSSVAATITIAGGGSFTENPYNSGQINPGTYTVSSSQPAGYTVSYSTNPAGGASTYTSGAIATVTVIAGRNVILWWKYTPIASTLTKGIIQGSMVDQNGLVTNLGSVVTISGIGSFTGSSYKSNEIPAGTYSISSSQPAGYTISYSTNPGGGASTYTAGAIVTVTVTAGQTTNLWWKYTPITQAPTAGTIQGYKVDQDGQLTDAGKTAIITINGIGSFTNNPYDSGKIEPTVYTVTSSQPTGYIVSYSTNPGGGASTYVSGSTATVTVTDTGTVTLWWKYSPITGVIKGSKVNENGQLTSAVSATPITIYGVGTFTDNPYNSNKIAPKTYTISSAEPTGYHVSYSINPEGGASTYVSGSTVTVDVTSGLTVDLWWKYTPISDLSSFRLELDNLRSSYSPSVLTHKEIRRMWTGWLTDNFSPAIHSSPNLSTIPRSSNIFYSEYINGSWTKPFPERTFKKTGFQINDPSVIKHPFIDSIILMYYTALADTDAEQKIFDRHKIGFALSSDGGRIWQDKGIAVDYPESGDGKGASSPSAITVNDEIWVYYHTGTSDFSRPINWRVRFSLNSFSAIKIGIPEQLNIAGFIPNNPNWMLTNLDVSYRNSQFVMIANTSDLKKIVRLVSDDGINWRKPVGGQDPMLEIPNYLVLTPFIEDITPDRYKVYFGLGTVSGTNIESSMIRSREFSASASIPTATPRTFFFAVDLAIGQTNDSVRALQLCLSIDSSLYPERLVTGYFGPLTRKAVIRFQEKFGIDGNGLVNLPTRQKLNQVCNL
ncbi:MAG: peptidoglycan-binding domain-containing protein [Patescibacteria group bacterium]